MTIPLWAGILIYFAGIAITFFVVSKIDATDDYNVVVALFWPMSIPLAVADKLSNKLEERMKKKRGSI